MSTDQYDAAQVVRIRMKTPNGEVWSRRQPRHVAERDVAGGPVHLSIEHAQGEPVTRAAIVRWTFD
jgi:hypothetical protein